MRRLLTPGWLAGHLLTLVLVTGMLGLAVWQFHRAAGGNALSWGYTVQWPIFAGFVVLIWAREVRRVLRGETAEATAPTTATTAGTATAAAGSGHLTGAAASSDPSPTAGQAGAPAGVRRPVVMRPAVTVDDDDDPEVAAYNRYLAWLNAHPEARPADYHDHVSRGTV